MWKLLKREKGELGYPQIIVIVFLAILFCSIMPAFIMGFMNVSNATSYLVGE